MHCTAEYTYSSVLNQLNFQKRAPKYINPSHRLGWLWFSSLWQLWAENS